MAIFCGCKATVDNPTEKANLLGGIILNKMSLGRFDFSLPEDFQQTGQSYSIYHVEVSTLSLGEKTISNIWTRRINEIKAEHISAGYPEQTIRTLEIDSGYPAVFYQRNHARSDLITLETFKPFQDHVLILTYEGKAGECAESDMKRLVEIVADSYIPGASHGFSVGLGSITSQPSRNERAMSDFRHIDGHIYLSIFTQTAGSYLSNHPLEDIEEDINFFASDGIKINVLKNEKRIIDGMEGFEGRVLFDKPDAEPEIRFTWFFPGVSMDSFKPEILIKLTAPKKNLDAIDVYWENLLSSFHHRDYK